MTDRPTTEQDLELTLATMHDQIVNAPDPALLTEGARVRLGEMYTTAEAAGDQGACAAIQKAWDDISALAVNETRAREVARSAMDIAQGYRGERDNAVKELKELSDDLDNVNLNNARVRRVHNEGLDSAFDEYEGFHCDCPGCACYETGHLPEISHDGVNMLIHAIMGSYGELTEKQTRQLTHFVNLFETSLEKSLARNWEIVDEGDDNDDE